MLTLVSAHGRGVRANKQGERVLSGKGGKGKGKGCFKYDWTLELEKPEEFEDLELYSYIYYDGDGLYDIAYRKDETIEAEALSGMGGSVSLSSSRLALSSEICSWAC